MFFAKTFVAVSGLATLASGHIIMAVPAVFSSPIVSSTPITGANFPCQQSSGGSYVGDATSMALGSDQPLSFIGTAVHGGGSCQVSITYDESPTTDSVWKVITSIEGGCPARDTAGNLGDDADAVDPYTYNFTIPSDIPTGKATLAWTWFNKVGNREMYMNCAPIEMTGTSGDQSSYDALPDMFTANIDNGCKTLTDKDVVFPNPGDLVYYEGNSADLASATGTCQTASAAGSGSAATTTAAGNSPATAATSSTAAATTADDIPGGVFITSAAAATTTAAAATNTEATSSSTSAAAAATSASSSSGSSSSSGAQSGACTTEGEWNCIDGSTFQQCAAGTWSAAQSVASGTSCTIGQSTSISIVASSGKTRKLAVRFRG